jgi:hypothetical protein
MSVADARDAAFARTDPVLAAAFDPRAASVDAAYTTALEEQRAACDPNLLPPAGVMGAHAHVGGEWMIGYRFMETHYQGMRDGTDHLSAADVFAQGFAQSPTSMSMQMHEVEAMYGMSDSLSLMVDVPYVMQSMPQVDSVGESFTTHSSGVGDVALGAAYTVKVRETDRCIATLGISLPTGSIDQRDDMPGCPDCRLEYAMQNGSGTFDLLPALAYVADCGDWAFGGQALGRVRIGINDNDYRLGDRGEITAWTARRFAQSFRASLRVAGSMWGNVHGADPELDPMMSPTNDASRQAGSRVDVALGIDWLAGGDKHMGSGIGVEFGVPVYQELDGPQLEADWFATIALRLGF